ncbi:MAG: T9SS type A sorting domain-containing protein [Bacteroidales bacterium]|nr:T9SS type A sorting domain-containing protein [Bacteroidales bacterium]
MMKKTTVFTIALIICFGLIVRQSSAQMGSTCIDPHIISSLPFNVTGLSTANTGNNYTSLSCAGTFPNFISGNDYVFTFTPSSTMNVKITLSNTEPAVAVFVTSDCPDVATGCVANNNSIMGNPVIPTVTLNAGTNYYITVSRLASMGISTDFDIEIVELFATDASVTDIESPVSNCNLTNTEQVRIKVKNTGTQSINNFDLGYSVNGVPVPHETINNALASGDSITHLFTQTADLSLQGTYVIEAYVILPGDLNHTNDTLEKNVGHFSKISTLPFTEDFESGDGGWVSGGTNSSWELGTPAGTVINTPATGGTNSWVTNLTGNHNLQENSYVYSPCFDFSSYPNVSLKIDIWYQTFPMFDGARLEASIDGGVYWFVVGNNSEPTNWYNAMMTDTIWTQSSYGWITAQHPLNFLGGESDVRLRIHYKTGMVSIQTDEGFAFDNIMIYECNDMPTAGFTYTQNGTTLSFTNTSQDATAYIWNFGDQQITTLPDTSTNPVHQYLINGQYNVTLAAYNDCGVSYYTETVNITVVGLEDESGNHDNFLYPNPASEEIRISKSELENQSYDVKIFNALGKEVYSARHFGNNSSINLKNLTPGFYLVKIDNQNNSFNGKFILNNQ